MGLAELKERLKQLKAPAIKCPPPPKCAPLKCAPLQCAPLTCAPAAGCCAALGCGACAASFSPKCCGTFFLGHFGTAAVVFGGFGLVVHGAVAPTLRPILYNHFSALWLTSMLMVAGIELVLTVRTLDAGLPPVQRLLGLGYFSFVLACSIMITLAYAVDSRVDLFFWALFQTLVAGCGIYGLLLLGRTGKGGGAEDEDVEAPGAGTKASNAMSRTDGAAEARPGVRTGLQPPPSPSAERNSGAVGGKSEQVYQEEFVLDCLAITRIVVRVFHSLFLVFLAAGAIVGAYAATAYQPSGVFVRLPVGGGGETVTIHHRCLDPSPEMPFLPHTRTVPTLWLTSSPAHGLTGDLWGVQHFLAELGWRTCAFDPPGFGYSSRVTPASVSMENYLPLLVEAVEDTGADIVFVGWGGGASAAVAVAESMGAKEPLVPPLSANFTVRGVVLVTVYPPGVEWELRQLKERLSDVERAQAREDDLLSRLSFAQAILGLALPWGLMPAAVPLVAPPPDYFPQERYDELRVTAWRPQYWVHQYWGIRQLQASNVKDDPLFSRAPLPSSLPVGHVLCSASGERPCQRLGGWLEGEACEEAKDDARFELARQFSLTRELQRNPSKRHYVRVEAENCTQALIVEYPKRTAGYVDEVLRDMLQ
jgi:pimeloyl-ACP methyl ester carboxylesterase